MIKLVLFLVSKGVTPPPPLSHQHPFVYFRQDDDLVVLNKRLEKLQFFPFGGGGPDWTVLEQSVISACSSSSLQLMAH